MDYSKTTVDIIVADYDRSRLMDLFTKLQSSNPALKVLTICEDGETLIDRAATMDVDAILMDFNLIDKTAIEVAEELDELSDNTEVFAISDALSAEFIFNAKKKGIAEIFKRENLVARDVANNIVTHIENKRREFEEMANQHGAIQKGTKNKKIIKEYITKTVKQSVILTYNIKGGVGKSTVATNLAVATKLSPYFSGKRIVLVDFDCGGANVGTLCNIPDMETVSRNLAAWESIEPEYTSPEEVDSLLIRGPHGLMVAPAPLNFSHAEKVGYELASKILEVLKKYFDIIVIDGAPNLSPLIDAALQKSTHILLIANPEGQSVKQLSRITHFIEEISRNGRDMFHILNKMFVVLNHAHGSSKWDLKPTEVAKTIGRPLLREIPNDDLVKKALHGNSGKLPIELEPHNEFSIAIKKLANDICGAYPEGFSQVDSKEKTTKKSTKLKKKGIFGFLKK